VLFFLSTLKEPVESECGGPVSVGCVFEWLISFLNPSSVLSIFYLKGMVPSNVKTMDISRGVASFVRLRRRGLFLTVYLLFIRCLPGLMTQ
jgi:TRAP-type mannitol/chloroaromatic compound transport system permease large subunit